MGSKAWTEEEDKLLREIASNMTLREMTEAIPGRGARGIYNRLGVLKLDFKKSTRRSATGGIYEAKPWTEEEDEKLVKMVEEEKSFRKIGVELGRAYSACRKRAITKGLVTKNKAPRAWTKEEVARLYELSERLPPISIAKKLGRLPVVVRRKMKELDLRYLSDVMSLRGMVEETGYTVKQLMRAKEALGQKWKKVPHQFQEQYAITFEQYEALMEHLKNDKWVRPDYATRFWERVKKAKRKNGCWRWTGGWQFDDLDEKREKRSFYPAKYAWCLVNGFEHKTRIYRTCNTRSCVRPDHHRNSERMYVQATKEAAKKNTPWRPYLATEVGAPEEALDTLIAVLEERLPRSASVVRKRYKVGGTPHADIAAEEGITQDRSRKIVQDSILKMKKYHEALIRAFMLMPQDVEQTHQKAA